MTEINEQIVRKNRNFMLHVLRNPFGWSDDVVREMRLKAADELGMTQQQFKAYVNARPNLFELQNRKDNQGHKFEKPGVGDLDKIIIDMKNFQKTGK